MKKKPVVTFDYDDAIYPFFEYFIKFLNKKWGTDFKFENHYSFDLAHVFGVSEGEIKQLLFEFDTTVESRLAKPYPDCHELLHAHREEIESHIVTARYPRALIFVERWLHHHHLHSVFENMHFAIPGRSKADVCLALGARVHVEDAVHNILAVAAVGIPVIVPNRPWNIAHELPENTYRVDTWPQIFEHINRIIRK
jgi:hypothetical protein